MVPIARVMEEDDDHPGTQLAQLAEVATEQHDEDHGVQQIVLEAGVSSLNSIRFVDTQGTQNHVQDIDPYQGRNDIKYLPLGGSLQNQQATSNKHQNRNVS